MKQAIRYRLYTEDLNRDKIMERVNADFHGYTVFDATGSWMGKTEKSIVIEIVSDSESMTDTMRADLALTVRALAGDIARMNWQQTVMVTREVIESEFVYVF